LIDPEIEILYCHEGWFAVDKPSGLSVHNDPGQDLVSILEKRIASDRSLCLQLCAKQPVKVYPVHRLDKETCGTILLATQKKALAALSECFARGSVKKKYIALVHGTFKNSDPGLYYFWDTPLTKGAGGRKNPKGKGKLFECRTGYRILDQSRHYSLLEIDLLTGRKHQIRRHAKICGHPIVGDSRYGSKQAVQFLKENHGFTRLGLHCRSLEFKFADLDESHFISSNVSLGEIKKILNDDK